MNGTYAVCRREVPPSPVTYIRDALLIQHDVTMKIMRQTLSVQEAQFRVIKCTQSRLPNQLLDLFETTQILYLLHIKVIRL